MGVYVEPSSICVDVDGTLLIWPTVPGSPRPGETPKVNAALVAALRRWKQANPSRVLVVWTMGGAEHARMAVKVAGIGDLCNFAMAKPVAFIDDAPADLLKRKRVNVVHPDAFIKEQS